MITITQARPSLARKLTILSGDLKLPNAVFGLPLAYIGMLLAGEGSFSWNDLLWITLAVAGARTFGFVSNQLADRDLDALHPAKWDRALPSGLITVPEMAGVGVIAGGSLSRIGLLAEQFGPPAFPASAGLPGLLCLHQTLHLGHATLYGRHHWHRNRGCLGRGDGEHQLGASLPLGGGLLLGRWLRPDDRHTRLRVRRPTRPPLHGPQVGRGFRPLDIAGVLRSSGNTLFGHGLSLRAGSPFLSSVDGRHSDFGGSSTGFFNPKDFERGHRLLFRLSGPFSLLLLAGVLLGLYV